MKKIWTAWKKTSLFFKLMLIYTVALIGGVIGLCVWEWDLLVDYQSDYDKRYAEAEEKAAKGNVFCIEEYVSNYTKELHRELVLEDVTEDNPYYTAEELVDYKLQSIDFENISYRRNEENYAEHRPVYDILAGDEVIAIVTLGAGSIDEFGFNTWRVSGVSVDDSLESLANVKLIIEEGMIVTVKDMAPAEGALTETTTITQNIYDRIYELSNEEEKLHSYTLTDILNEDDIKVVDASGNELSYTEVEGVRVYKGQVDEATKEWCSIAADNAVKAYVEYTNRWITMEQMLAYTVSDTSNASAASAIKRSAESVEFARKPSTIEYTSKTVENIHVIEDDLFYCDVKYAISKKVNSQMVDETIMLTLIMRKQGGVWLIDRMAFNG